MAQIQTPNHGINDNSQKLVPFSSALSNALPVLQCHNAKLTELHDAMARH